MGAYHDWSKPDLQWFDEEVFRRLLQRSDDDYQVANAVIIYALLDACHTNSDRARSKRPLEVLYGGFHKAEGPYRHHLFRFPHVFEAVVTKYIQEVVSCSCNWHSNPGKLIDPNEPKIEISETCNAKAAAVWMLFAPFISIDPRKPVNDDSDRLKELESLHFYIARFLEYIESLEKSVLATDEYYSYVHGVFSVLLNISERAQYPYDGKTEAPDSHRLLKPKVFDDYQKKLSNSDVVKVLGTLRSYSVEGLQPDDWREVLAGTRTWPKPEKLVLQRILHIRVSDGE